MNKLRAIILCGSGFLCVATLVVTVLVGMQNYIYDSYNCPSSLPDALPYAGLTALFAVITSLGLLPKSSMPQ